MDEKSLHDEIRELAGKVAGGSDEVADLGADAAAVYRRERELAVGMVVVQSMLALGPDEVDEDHPLLVACRGRLRDRLRGLLEWAEARDGRRMEGE